MLVRVFTRCCPIEVTCDEGARVQRPASSDFFRRIGALLFSQARVASGVVQGQMESRIGPSILRPKTPLFGDQ